MRRIVLLGTCVALALALVVGLGRERSRTSTSARTRTSADWPAEAAAWAAAGHVVALETDGRIELHDLSGGAVRTIPGTRPELSGDGRWLLAAGPEGGLVFHDVARARA